METILYFATRYWDALMIMTAEMAPYLILGFFIAGLLRTFVPRQVYSRHLSPRTMGSVVKAAAIGVPLPLCSCGVIPTAVSLRKEGASHGACASFLIATPQTGVDSIVATYSLMGLPFAIVRPIAALFTAMFGGWMVNRFALEDEAVSAQAAQSGEHDHCDCGHEHGHSHESCSCCHEHSHASAAPISFWDKLLGALSYGFVEMLQDVGKWLVIGLLIAALITVAVPNEWLAALHEYKLLNMLIVLAVAIPMYVCATGSIPIAVSLMAKGLTPGAALVLLMAGPAVNSASMLVIGKVFGRRTLWLYIVSIVIGAMLFGLGIDYLLPQHWFAVASSIASPTECAHCLTPWDWGWMALLLVLLINAFWQMHHGGHNHSNHEHHHEHHHEHSEDHDNCHNEHHHEHSENHDNCHNEHHHEHCEHNDDCHEAATDASSSSSTSLYAIDGMSCNHCAANVERAIRSIPGVEDVEVSLAKSQALVSGHHDHAALIARIKSFGYEAREKN